MKYHYTIKVEMDGEAPFYLEGKTHIKARNKHEAERLVDEKARADFPKAVWVGCVNLEKVA